VAPEAYSGLGPFGDFAAVLARQSTGAIFFGSGGALLPELALPEIARASSTSYHSLYVAVDTEELNLAAYMLSAGPTK
jgi:hypothetical protein